MATRPEFTVGQVLTAAQVESILDYVDETPTSRRRRSTTDAAVASSSATTINMNGENFDHSESHWTAAAAQDTITTPGVYDISAGLVWQSNATGYRRLRILVNSTPVAGSHITPGAGIDAFQMASTRYELADGDTVSVDGTQNSGGSLNVLASEGTFRALRLVRPS